MTSPDSRNANVVLGADVSGYSTGMAAADAQTRGLIGSIDQLTTKIGNLNRAAANKLTGFSKADTAALTGTIATAATYEKQLSTLAGTAAVTGQSLRGTKKAIEDTFTSLPVSRTNVIQLVEALDQLGVKGPNALEKLSKTYEKLDAVTGEGAIQLASGLQSLNRLMGGAGPDQTARYANALLAVSKNAGVSATSVLDFAQQIGPMARAAGIGETAVMGISAAFAKSGQDGRVAANVFNSIVADITREIQLGSPEIAKYANLLGTTAEQFKNMPAADRLRGVFSALSGPRGARELEQLGYGDSIRTQAALAAFTQSGELDKQLAVAASASTNTNQLDKGSSAAFHNVADELVQLRNTATEASTAIGTTFLTPMNAALGGVNSLASGVGHLVHEFAPLIGVLGVVGAAFTGIVGTAMHLGGIIGGAVLGRFLLRSTGTAAFGMGRQLVNGVDPRDMSAGQQRAYERMAAGNMNWMQQRMFLAGNNAQSWLNNRVPGEGIGVGQMFKMGALAPLRAFGYLGRDTANFTRSAMEDDFNRRGLNWGAGGGWRQAVANLRDSAARPMGTALRDEVGNAAGGWWTSLRATMSAGRSFVGAGLGGLNKALGGASPAAAWSAEMDKARGAMMAHTAATGGAIKSLDAFVISLTGAARGATAFTTAAVRNTAMGALKVTGMAGGAVLGAGLRGLGMLGSLASSPLGMLGLIGGTMIASNVQGSDDAFKARQQDQDYLQPIRLYNDQLGIATKSLNAFASAADSAAATPGLNGVTASSKVADVKRVDATSDVLAARDVKGDPKLAAAAKVSKSGSFLASVAQSYNLSDPRNLQLFKANALHEGYSVDAVQQALNALPDNLTAAGSTTARTNFSAFGNAVRGHEGSNGIIGGVAHFIGFSSGESASKSGRDAAASVFSAINDRRAVDTQAYGAAYAGQRQLVDSLDALSSLAKGVGTSNRNKAAAGLSSDTSAANAARRNQLELSLKQAFALSGTPDLSNMDFRGKNQAQIEDALISAVRNSKGGKQALSAFVSDPAHPGTLDPTKFNTYLRNLGGIGTTDAETAALRRQGPLGRLVARAGGSIQGALNATAEGDPHTYAKGLADLGSAAASAAAAARKQGDAMSTSITQLDSIMQIAGTTSSPLYQLADAARTAATALQGYREPQLSQAQQFKDAGTRFAGAVRTANAPHATTEQIHTVQAGGDERNTWESALENQRQFLIQSYKMAQQWGTQQRRAYEDYQHQISISNRDFYLQMGYQQADFNKSQLRAQQDFSLQLERQAQDAAKTIYDPFNRVEAQFTIDAGTLLQNLQDQNGRIARQMNELRQAKRAGLSQQSIDTLQLADPRNSQQVDNLVQGLQSDPALTQKINAQVNMRLKGTTAITQSTFSDSYRRTIADFTKSTDRAVADFGVQRDRAVQAQHTALGDMAYSYHQMTERSVEDLRHSMEEMTGDFSAILPKAMNEVTSQMGHNGDILLQKLKDLASAYRGTMAEIAALANVHMPTVPLAQRLSAGSAAMAASRLPGQSGMAVAAKVTWNELINEGYTARQLDAYIMENPVVGAMLITNRPKGHAEGGISLKHHVAEFSENNKAEMIVPLENARGVAAMTDMYRAVSQAVLAQLHTSPHPMYPTGTGSTVTTWDYSTEFTGDITVVAQDTKKFMADLEAKKRLSQLTHPARRGGS